MSTNLQLYNQSAINFLQSCTIIFSPLAYQINNNLSAQGVVIDQSSPATWKYYLNLSGHYFVGPDPNNPIDIPMIILSLDTQQSIIYSTDNLHNHPKTKAAYVVGSDYYNTLCQKYPTQTDLIKSIRYPVDLSSAVNANDFTLLGYGAEFLESNEQDVIIYELNTFLNYVSTRWYFSFLAYEKYYIWAFWASLWQQLPMAIYTARLKYLHTSSAHSFHIWSYLLSNGISDYSDILTPQQSLFLYRNLRYIHQNKGKQSTLVLLVNNLLNSLNVGLVGKTIYMNTDTNSSICAWTPEFVSTIVPTNNAQSLELIAPASMTDINAELVKAGVEINSTTEYIANQQTKIGRTQNNILPTKLVEIQKIDIDQKYGTLLNNFILDNLVWYITSNMYTPKISITDPTTNITILLSAQDALALYYYAIHRSGHEQPVLLPTVYNPTCAFRPNVVSSTIPTEFHYQGKTYPTKSYLALELFTNGLVYSQLNIDNPDEFSNLIASQFLVLINYVRYSRIESNKIASEMFLEYCNNYVLQTTPYTFNLSTVPDYLTWINNLNLNSFIATLDNTSNFSEAYINLANVITTALIPQNSTIYNFFAYTNTSVDNLYDRLRSLFVQLCSYNICFLDTTRTSGWWMLYEKIQYEVNSQTNTLSLNIDGVVSTTDAVVSLENTEIPEIDLSETVQPSNTSTTPITISEQEIVSMHLTDSRLLFDHSILKSRVAQQTISTTIKLNPTISFTVIPQNP